MNNLYITLIILLGILLIFQTLGNKARLRKLVKALKKNDRKLLNEKLSFGSSTAYKDLERQIIEQIFEAENLEKRVVRREDLISSVVDGLSDAVIVFDKSFKIRFTNPSACRVFGWASHPLELNAVEQMSNDKLIKLIDS